MSIFSKRNTILHFKTTFCSFEGMWYFGVELCISFSKLLSATKQELFCITERAIGQGPSNHTPILYELLISVVWLTLSFGEVLKTCRRMHEKFRWHVPLYTSDVCENIFACLFSFHNTISLSRIEQVCLIRLRFERSSPIVGQRKLLCRAYLKGVRNIIIYVAWWWEKYLSKRSLIKHNCS